MRAGGAPPLGSANGSVFKPYYACVRSQRQPAGINRKATYYNYNIKESFTQKLCVMKHKSRIVYGTANEALSLV